MRRGRGLIFGGSERTVATINSYDCIIRGGTVVHHDRTERADIGIIGGVIASVGDLRGMWAEVEISAEGKRVIPGGIDPHTHLDSEYAGLRGGDTVHSGTLAAAYGGTTCLLDFAGGIDGLAKNVADRRAYFEAGEPVIDFGLHSVVESTNLVGPQQVKELAKAGISSVKYYMNNSDELSDGILLQLLKAGREEGVLVCVHAENEQIAKYCTAELMREGRLGWEDIPRSRPPICEQEAALRAMALAQEAETGIYIVHVSSGKTAQYLARAREEGKPFYGETCAQYLVLTDEVFGRADGELYKVTPPLRSAADHGLLWNALRTGTLQALGSDHVSYTKEEKRRRLTQGADGQYVQDFTKVADGLPGIELRLPTLINGVLDGQLLWETLVCINSYQPARLFGLYPSKGEIAPGFDADIVILDENSRLTVNTSEDLHMNCDHTPFLGVTYRCLPQTVLVRGQLVIYDGKHTGLAPGRYVARKMERALLRDNRLLR